MKRLLLFCSLIFTVLCSFAQGTWKIAGGKITSPWADSISPSHVLPDYPRPQMQRSDWQNLNGLWQYSIVPVSTDESIPNIFDGNILVPFAFEDVDSREAHVKD